MNDASLTLRSFARRVLTVPLIIAAALYFLFEEFIWVKITRLVAWIGARPAVQRPIQALRRALQTLPPYAAMALFLIPVAALVPFKLAAVYLIGTGHVVAG